MTPPTRRRARGIAIAVNLLVLLVQARSFWSFASLMVSGRIRFHLLALVAGFVVGVMPWLLTLIAILGTTRREPSTLAN